MHPSKKSLAREHEKLRGMIDKKRCFQPLPGLIRQTNRSVRERLARHLRRRSQRAWRPAEGTSGRNLRLLSTRKDGTHLPVNASHNNALLKPDVGNLHVRFDEGEGSRRSLALCLSSRGFLLYST
jgi:hypothetical protein